EPVGALGGRAGRRGGSSRARPARAPEPRVRGALRLPLRRLRQPAAEVGDPPDPARADRAHTRGGARDGAGRARGDRRGSVATTMIEIVAGPFRFRARFEEERAPATAAAFRRALPFESKLIQARWSGEAAWIPLGDLDFGVG